ncbi:ATP-dependent zinc protease, partial [Pseudomonas syringae]
KYVQDKPAFPATLSPVTGAA